MLQFSAESDQLQRRIACGLWDGFDVGQIIGEKRNWITTDHIWSQPDHLHLRAAQGEICFFLWRRDEATCTQSRVSSEWKHIWVGNQSPNRCLFTSVRSS